MENLSRRNVLISSIKAAGGLIAATTFSQAFFSCQKNSASSANSSAAIVDEKVGSASCEEPAKLSDQEKTTRASLKYTDSSPVNGRTCDNCKLYTRPAPGSFCGGCKIVSGPIHPKGYCTAWIHLM